MPKRRLSGRPTAHLAGFVAAVSAVALVVALPAAAGTSRPAAAPQDGTAAPPTPRPAPHWYRQVEPALAAAEAANKLVLVDLYADWCGWCKQLDVEFRTPHFARWAQDYVLLRVDTEDGGEGSAMQDRLGVHALPTLALIDHRQVRVGLIQGYKPAAQLTRALDDVVATYHAKRQRLAEQAASDDRDTRLAAADELRAMNDGAAAAAIYRGVLAGQDLPAADRVRIGGALTDALILSGDLDAAHRSLHAARQQIEQTDGPSRVLLERILDGLTLKLTQDLADCDQVAELETFLRQHPSSSFASRVRNRLDHLKSGSAAGCT